MTLINRTSRLTVCLLAAALASAYGQQGVGKKYGSRDPQTCASLKEPSKGAPAPAVAAKYVTCTMEGETNGNTLFLVENVKVEVGSGVLAKDIAPIHRPGEVDPNSMVYSIRGSYKKYLCGVSHPSGVLANAGKNCRIYEVPKATGVCYKNTFGDWACSMPGETDYGTADQAPPK